MAGKRLSKVIRMACCRWGGGRPRPCVAQADATQGHGRVHLDEEAGAHLLERPRALEAGGGEAPATECAGPGEAAEAGASDEDVSGGLGGYNQPSLGVYADCRSAPSGPT